MSNLIVPVGEGIGLAKSGSAGSGMLTFRGAIGALSASRPTSDCVAELLSSINDWKTNLMFVLGKRNTHLIKMLNTRCKILIRKGKLEKGSS